MQSLPRSKNSLKLLYHAANADAKRAPRKPAAAYHTQDLTSHLFTLATRIYFSISPHPPQPWKQFLINKIFLGKIKWFKGKPWPVCYANESVPSLPRNITNISKYDKMIYWQCCRTRDGVAGHRDATLSSDWGSTGSKHSCVIPLNDAFSRWKGPLRTIESSLSLEVGL